MMPPRHGRLRNTQPPHGGLSAAVGWTTANAAVPGTALLRTGRNSGWIYLAVFVGIPVVVTLAYLLFGGVDLMLKMAVRPKVLAVAAIGVAVVALAWALLVMWGNHLLNGLFGLERGKRTVSIVTALALIAGVGVPAVSVVRALEAQHSLLLNSFASDDEADETGAMDSDVSGSDEDPWAGVPRLNIMILGDDSGEGRIGTRPDTIMVASIDTSSGVTSLFNIPRNLQYVQFPTDSPMHDVFPHGFDAYGLNQNLINAVWTWATDHPELFADSSHPGLTATRHAVEHTLGLQIDRYGMVNLQGFEDIIDALGGVEIVVERRIPIGGGTNQLTGMPYPVDGYIEPGRQTLNGYEALWYVRSRHESNDFDRMCRQQRMIRAVTDSVNPAAIAGSFTQLVRAAEHNVSTSIRVSELDAMIDLLFMVQHAGISSHPVTPEVTNPANPDFNALNQWVDEAIAEDVAEATGADESGAPAGNGAASPGQDGGSGTDAKPGLGQRPSPSPEAPADSRASESALAGCMP